MTRTRPSVDEAPTVLGASDRGAPSASDRGAPSASDRMAGASAGDTGRASGTVPDGASGTVNGTPKAWGRVGLSRLWASFGFVGDPSVLIAAQARCWAVFGSGDR